MIELAAQRPHLVWAIFVAVSVPLLAIAGGWRRPRFPHPGDTPHQNE
jgi:hypothetical protein